MPWVTPIMPRPNSYRRSFSFPQNLDELIEPHETAASSGAQHPPAKDRNTGLDLLARALTGALPLPQLGSPKPQRAAASRDLSALERDLTEHATEEQKKDYLPQFMLAHAFIGTLSGTPLKIIEMVTRENGSKPVVCRDDIRADARAEAAVKRESLGGGGASKKRSALDDFVEVRKKDVEQLTYNNQLKRSRKEMCKIVPGSVI